MPDPNEKDRRKQLLEGLNQQAREAFENSLPMSRELFQQLFDYLDEQLGEEDCDHSYSMTRAFLKEKQIADPEQVLLWLENQGGGCDCEVLANVEERFD